MTTIAIDCRSIVSRNTGTGYWLRNILEELFLLDKKRNYLLLANLPLGLETERYQNVTVVSVDARLNDHPGNELYENFTLPSLLKKYKADYYLSSPFRLPYVSLPCPSTTVIFDLTPFKSPESMKPLFRYYLEHSLSWTAKKAASVITISETVKAEIEERYPTLREKITVIPPAASQSFGVMPSRDNRDAVNERYRLPEEFLLFVGTVEPRKNLDFLLDALEGAKAPLPLIIAGQEGWKSQKTWKRIKGLQEKKKVFVTEYLEREELYVLYNLAKAFVFPSKYEGFGMPLLEAATAGLPIYCSDIPVFREIGGDAFTYFPLNDAGNLSGILDTIASSPAKRNSYYPLLQNYQWSLAARKMMRLFDEAGV